MSSVITLAFKHITFISKIKPNLKTNSKFSKLKYSRNLLNAMGPVFWKSKFGKGPTRAS